MTKINHTLSFIIIWHIGRVYRIEAGNSKAAKTFVLGVFRKFSGDHCRVTHHIFISFIIPNTWEVEKGIAVHTF